jgi:hypothetical protein
VVAAAIDSMAMKRAGANIRIQTRTSRKYAGWLAAAMVVCTICLAPPAQTQEAQPAQPAQQAQKQDTGVFGSIGRWFEQGFANLKNTLTGAKTNIDDIGGKAANAGKAIGDKAAEAGKNAADAAKGAAEAVKKLPSTRVVEGHERCETAANGAPDCRVAALTICQAKGFAGGQSVDFVSAEKCPAAVWMNRRKPLPGECVTETFVTRAMCQ